ncbi:MAG: hypothetical protein LC663_06060, partial [Actinobacteria bacterium]|nr:hypothetical protein [Actinomycetota bacterium]
IYRRAALDRTGGFDERFKLAFLEDSDVAFAVQQQVAPILWDPSVVVYHLVLPASRRKFMREARKRFYNPLLFAKHPALYVRHIKPVIPGIPRVHARYMIAVVIFVALVITSLLTSPGVWGGAVFAAIAVAFYYRRLVHAYRARDVITCLQVAAHPFVQTYWVIRGAIAFKSFSFDL